MAIAELDIVFDARNLTHFGQTYYCLTISARSTLVMAFALTLRRAVGGETVFKAFLLRPQMHL